MPSNAKMPCHQGQKRAALLGRLPGEAGPATCELEATGSADAKQVLCTSTEWLRATESAGTIHTFTTSLHSMQVAQTAAGQPTQAVVCNSTAPYACVVPRRKRRSFSNGSTDAVKAAPTHCGLRTPTYTSATFAAHRRSRPLSPKHIRFIFHTPPMKRVCNSLYT